MESKSLQQQKSRYNKNVEEEEDVTVVPKTRFNPYLPFPTKQEKDIREMQEALSWLGKIGKMSRHIQQDKELGHLMAGMMNPFIREAKGMSVLLLTGWINPFQKSKILVKKNSSNFWTNIRNQITLANYTFIVLILISLQLNNWEKLLIICQWIMSWNMVSQ